MQRSEDVGADLWPEALLGVEAASGEGEGCEGASAAVTSTETPSAEGARSREAAERRAALRRQAFFCAGRRQVGHCMHRACRLLPPEPGRPRPPWSPQACQRPCLFTLECDDRHSVVICPQPCRSACPAMLTVPCPSLLCIAILQWWYARSLFC